jgi:hypothetical protein
VRGTWLPLDKDAVEGEGVEGLGEGFPVPEAGLLGEEVEADGGGDGVVWPEVAGVKMDLPKADDEGVNFLNHVFEAAKGEDVARLDGFGEFARDAALPAGGVVHREREADWFRLEFYPAGFVVAVVVAVAPVAGHVERAVIHK